MIYFVPSNRSLWVDEGYTALSALEPSFSEWVNRFPVNFGYDPLKPLEGFATFAFSRFTGSSELALRYHNALWILLGVFACTKLALIFRLPWLPFVFLLHPFVWVYYDEVRPYAMQLGGGALLLWGCLSILQFRGSNLAGWLVFGSGGFLLSGSSLLGGIPVAFAFVGLVVLGVARRWKITSAGWIAIGAFLGSQILWLAYYAWQMVLWRGQEAARQWDVGLVNLAYSAFEFLGMGGLSPSREILRATIKSEGISQGMELFFTPWSLLIPVVLALWLFLAFWAAKALFRPSEAQVGGYFCLIIFLVTGAFLFAAAYVFKWPFWGRHLAGIFPWFLFLALFGTAGRSSRFKTIVLLLLSLTLTVSSVRWAVAQNPYREDYRSAADLAKSALTQN
ncbi:MAG: hypothetical protein WC003_16360, partial [Terrimicrobiaceae bacterium]